MKFNRKHPDRGYLHDRIDHCMVERAFAKKWEMSMTEDRALLDAILGESATLRDRYICATLIQWLGSNVGWGWLSDALMRAGWALNGNFANRGHSNVEDELLRAIEQANLDIRWRTKHQSLVREAAQLSFDLSEPS